VGLICLFGLGWVLWLGMKVQVDAAVNADNDCLCRTILERTTCLAMPCFHNRSGSATPLTMCFCLHFHVTRAAMDRAAGAYLDAHEGEEGASTQLWPAAALDHLLYVLRRLVKLPCMAWLGVL